MTRRSFGMVLCATALMSTAAIAQDGPPPDPYFRVFTLFIKGGASFYQADPSPLNQWGPSWGAGVGLSPAKWLTFEFAYEGSHHWPAANIGTTPGSLRTGVDALLKLTLPLEWFRPFVGAGYGVGWLNNTGVNTGAGSAFTQEVPVAGGIEFMAGPLVLGARFTYRFRFMNGNQALDGLGDVQATIGAAF